MAAIIEVDATIVGSSPTYPGMDPFIDIANEMVTECCTLQGQTYTSYRLEMIERWLTAHFYAIRDPRVEMEAAGSVRESFNRVTGLGLQGTQYGQQVLRLDTAGGLAAKDNKPQHMRDLPIGITYLGSNRGRCG